jgi:hypothetical protein
MRNKGGHICEQLFKRICFAVRNKVSGKLTGTVKRKVKIHTVLGEWRRRGPLSGSAVTVAA